MPRLPPDIKGVLPARLMVVSRLFKQHTLRQPSQRRYRCDGHNEQILRTGSCGALIFCARLVQSSSLRRVHLAAQSFEHCSSWCGHRAGRAAGGAYTFAAPVGRRIDCRHSEAACPAASQPQCRCSQRRFRFRDAMDVRQFNCWPLPSCIMVL